MSKPFFDLSLRLVADFPESRRLRMHVDLNEDENILVFPYYQHTLLRLLQEDSELSDAARKKSCIRQGKLYKHCIARTGSILLQSLIRVESSIHETLANN
jgi:hypothetical protein